MHMSTGEDGEVDIFHVGPCVGGGGGCPGGGPATCIIKLASYNFEDTAGLTREVDFLRAGIANQPGSDDIVKLYFISQLTG